jgi:RNA polymerase sigma-70 factor (ECF subfamily)
VSPDSDPTGGPTRARADSRSEHGAAPDQRGFRTTRWSLVETLRSGGGPEAREALAQLCEAYWYPLYAYARRGGTSADEALDLTQGFFALLLDRRDLERVERAGGRLRSYLLVSMKHYLSGQRERQRALVRGGGAALLSIDFRDAEGRYAAEPADLGSPERIFERAWACEVIGRARARLRAEHEAEGKGQLFARLETVLLGEQGVPPRRALAQELGTTEGALNVAVHRLRRRFAASLRAEVADTLSDPSQVERELRILLEVLDS